MRSGVLFVSGQHDDARRLSRMLEGLPLRLDHVETIQGARAMLRRDDYDVVLTETVLSDGSWVDVLFLARNSARGLEVIVTDLHADARFWAEALNRGAYDVLPQPFCASEVRRILANAASRLAASASHMAAV